MAPAREPPKPRSTQDHSKEEEELQRQFQEQYCGNRETSSERCHYTEKVHTCGHKTPVSYPRVTHTPSCPGPSPKFQRIRCANLSLKPKKMRVKEECPRCKDEKAGRRKREARRLEGLDYEGWEKEWIEVVDGEKEQATEKEKKNAVKCLEEDWEVVDEILDIEKEMKSPEMEDKRVVNRRFLGSFENPWCEWDVAGLEE